MIKLSQGETDTLMAALSNEGLMQVHSLLAKASAMAGVAPGAFKAAIEHLLKELPRQQLMLTLAGVCCLTEILTDQAPRMRDGVVFDG